MTDISKFDENYKLTGLISLMNPNARNTKKTTTRYFIIQLLKTSDKPKILRASSQKKDMIYMEKQE